MVYQVLKRIEFCYGHRILNYDGPCRHLHGHNAVAEFVVNAAALDGLGMACDFRRLKATMKQWIDDQLDHRMILAADDPLVPLLQARGEPIFVSPIPPTAEAIAKTIFDAGRAHGFALGEVRLWETPNSCAVYRAER